MYFCNTQSLRVEIESSVRDSSRLLTFIKPQILFYSNVFVRSMNENHDKKIYVEIISARSFAPFTFTGFRIKTTTAYE